MFLDAASEVVDCTAGFARVGVARSGEEAVELALQTRPDLVLLDVRMPGMGGIEAAWQIRESHPDAVIVMITADSGAERLERSQRNAASAVLEKVKLNPRTLAELWRRHSPVSG